MREAVATFLNDFFTSRPLLRRISENFSWLFFERLFLMGMSFGIGVWLVRYLGPEDYGRYSYALSFAALFGTVAHLGLNSIVVREMARERHGSNEVFWTAIVLKGFGAAVALLATLTTVWVVDDDSFMRLLVGLAAVGFVFLPANVVELWFQSEIRSKYVVWARTGSSVLTNLLKVGALLLALPLVAFVGLQVAGGFLLACGLVLVFLRWGPKDCGFAFDGQLAKDMLTDSWPLIIAGLSVAVYMKIDRVMLGNMIDQETVGIYSTAAQLSELWYFIPTLIGSTVFPVVAKLSEAKDQAAYDERMQFFYDAMALFSYAVALPLTFLATPVIIFLFGAEYVDAGAILKIHIWALVFVSLGVARSKYLVAENFTRFSMIATFLGSITNVLINLVLIPKYGGVGAAWATLISYAIAGWATCFLFSPIRATGVQITKALLLPFRLRDVTRRVLAVVGS